MRNSLRLVATLVRGWLSTSALGLLSAVPLIGHLLAPRRYALLRDWLNKAFLPEPRTELTFDAEHRAIPGRREGFVDGLRRRRKGRTSGQRFGSGRPDAAVSPASW